MEVFGKATIMKYQVTGFFFQLLATGILGLEWKDGTVVFVIQRNKEGDFLYEDKLVWEGIIMKNRGTGMGASFGYHLRGEHWGYHPCWYKTNWSPETAQYN